MADSNDNFIRKTGKSHEDNHLAIENTKRSIIKDEKACSSPHKDKNKDKEKSQEQCYQRRITLQSVRGLSDDLKLESIAEVMRNNFVDVRLL